MVHRRQAKCNESRDARWLLWEHSDVSPSRGGDKDRDAGTVYSLSCGAPLPKLARSDISFCTGEYLTSRTLCGYGKHSTSRDHLTAL